VHDFMVTHNWDNNTSWGGYGKQDNLAYRSWLDDHNWRAGLQAPTTSVLFPENQPRLATYPDTLPPYQQQATGAAASGYMIRPTSVVDPVGRTVTITWYTNEKTITRAVQFGTASTTISGTPVDCTASGSSTHIVDQTTIPPMIATYRIPLAVWRNQCTVAIPAPFAAGSSVFYSVASTDAAGNAMSVGFNPQQNMLPVSGLGGAGTYYCIPTGSSDQTTYGTVGCQAMAVFTAPQPATTSSVSGMVTNSATNFAFPNVVMNLTGQSTASVTVTTSGLYSFTGLANGAYTLTPVLSGYTFSPPSFTYNFAAPTTEINQNVAATSGAPTYTISGTVSGAVVQGVTVSMTGCATASATTNSAGGYTLTGAVAGTCTITPTYIGYTFTPASTTVAVSTANVTGQNFTSSGAANFSLSGSITGVVSAQITVSLSGAATTTTTTALNGNFSFTNLVAGSYTVTPSLTGYTFSPVSTPVTISTANITGVTFTSSLTTFTISGTVSGAVSSGVTIALVDGAISGQTTTDASGNYSFTEPAGQYTLTPTLTGYVFAPASLSISVTTANVTGQNFTSTAATYSISGNVTGVISQGVTVSLNGVSTATTTTDASGVYIFAGLANGNYTLTPSLAGYTFTPVNLAVTVSGVSITGQNFTSASGGPPPPKPATLNLGHIGPH
jgi:hypothetical protein